jgi:hypothetical protein
LGLRGLALTPFRAFAGLMLSGFPAGGVAAASFSLKNVRHPGVSWDLFLIMQAVMRATSGMSAPQRRNASPLQACSCSGVWARPALGSIENAKAVASIKPKWKFLDRTASMDSPEAMLWEVWVKDEGFASRLHSGQFF